MKAQTATEFLIITAAILVVIGIVLNAFDLFPFDAVHSDEKAARQYWKSAELSINGYAVNSTHLILRIQNNMFDPIRLRNTAINSTRVANHSIRFDTGQELLLSIPFSKGQQVGQRYEYELWFNYTNLDNNQLYTFYGQVPIVGDVAVS